MLLHVTKAKYIEDYKVEVSFNNGRKGAADLFDDIVKLFSENIIVCKTKSPVWDDRC